MPRRPTGKNTVVWQLTIDERDDRAAKFYAEKNSMHKSTVYSRAIAWYLDNPRFQDEKEFHFELPVPSFPEWWDDERE